LSNEAIEIAKTATNITSIDQLKLVNTGCDSYVAHMKEFKHLSKDYTVGELTTTIQQLKSPDTKHLVLTGGESLLKPQQLFYSEFLSNRALGFTHVTFETNGTQQVTKEMATMMQADNKEYIFSVSTKLSNSGETHKRRVIPGAIHSYQTYGAMVYLKFVIQSADDINEVNSILQEYAAANIDLSRLTVYFMPCGGTVEEYTKYKALVKEIAKNTPNVQFSERAHLDWYGNAWST
jgi:organic radical activating enzyme